MVTEEQLKKEEARLAEMRDGLEAQKKEEFLRPFRELENKCFVTHFLGSRRGIANEGIVFTRFKEFSAPKDGPLERAIPAGERISIHFVPRKRYETDSGVRIEELDQYESMDVMAVHDFKQSVVAQISLEEYQAVKKSLLASCREVVEFYKSKYGSRATAEENILRVNPGVAASREKEAEDSVFQLDFPYIDLKGWEIGELGGEYNPFIVQETRYLITPNSLRLARRRIQEAEKWTRGFPGMLDSEVSMMQTRERHLRELEARLNDAAAKWARFHRVREVLP